METIKAILDLTIYDLRTTHRRSRLSYIDLLANDEIMIFIEFCKNKKLLSLHQRCSTV